MPYHLQICSATIHQCIQGPKVIKSYDKSKDQRPKSCSEGPAKEKAMADPAAGASQKAIKSSNSGIPLVVTSKHKSHRTFPCMQTVCRRRYIHTGRPVKGPKLQEKSLPRETGSKENWPKKCKDFNKENKPFC